MNPPNPIDMDGRTRSRAKGQAPGPPTMETWEGTHPTINQTTEKSVPPEQHFTQIV